MCRFVTVFLQILKAQVKVWNVVPVEQSQTWLQRFFLRSIVTLYRFPITHIITKPRLNQNDTLPHTSNTLPF